MAELFCGTGTGNFPQPGDPDLNNSALTAVPAFGGIDVSWTYPGVNPHAVAHTILYRSTNADPFTKARHKIVTGDYFYDKTTTATLIEYFYWIQIVSVNGTVGELIGPASAIARPTITQIMEGLTGQIDEGFLGQHLKGRLNEIDLNKQALYDEMALRAADDEALGVAFSQVQAQADDSLALLQQEVQARTEADSTMVVTMNTLYSQYQDNLAAVSTEMGTFIDRVNGDLTDIGAYFSVKTDVNGLIGGFGVHNDGSIVEAGFDVDRFWVGRTDTADGTKKGIKPFIVEGDETFIKEAVIKSLTFDKLRASDGSVIVENGKMKAAYLDVANLSVQWGSIQNVDIQTGHIRNGAITNAKIGNLQVTAAKIANANITNAKIGNAAVDTLQIKGQAVTFPNQAYTAASVLATTGVQSLTVPTTGAPIIVTCSLAYEIGVADINSGGSATLEVRASVGGSVVYPWTVAAYQEFSGISRGIISFTFKAAPAASSGTTFSLDARVSGGGASGDVSARSIVTIEAKR